MGCLSSKGRGSFGFGVNLGTPIVTNGNLLHSCVKVRESTELSFGVVSGIGRGMGILEGVHVPQGEGGWVFFPIVLGREWALSSQT